MDTPILSPKAPVDAYIDVMRVDMGPGEIGYLHTSPEYAMKKLLAKGSGDIYQLSHVFRANEKGPLHMPELTMLEWYRLSLSFEELIQETLELTHLFLGPLPRETLTYREAFRTHAALDPFKDDLLPKILTFSPSAKEWDRDTQLNLLFSHLVEPQLGRDKLTVITEFPGTQAALAKTEIREDFEVAKRFEVYFQGVELANGFDELADGKVQMHRFLRENQKRIDMGKEALPIDEEFVEALDRLPDAVGVAVGFDRLVQFMTTRPRALS